MNLFKASFSGFSVDDLAAAKKFYVDTLGFALDNEDMGLQLTLPNGHRHFIYQKDDHKPATYTALNFAVDDIDEAIAQLRKKGITFEQYDLGGGAVTDENGVLRGRAANMGPDIAWFKDPAGNILAILQAE